MSTRASIEMEQRHHITSIYGHKHIPYTYKVSRDVNFANDPNLGFSRVDLLLLHLVFKVYYEDLNFVDDKLLTKTAKFTSLENLYVYGSILIGNGAHTVCLIVSSTPALLYYSRYIVCTTMASLKHTLCL